jgi:hypothetical protein
MLTLKPNCECCDADLDPSGPGARICSFECTFCDACASGRLGGRCPNCGGDLQPRPARGPAALKRFPAASERTPLNAKCAAA